MQVIQYWLVKLNPQPRHDVLEYRFENLTLVWDSINITWGKFPQHERPVLDPVNPNENGYAAKHIIRDHSGTEIGTVEHVRQSVQIHSEPTHL